MRLTGAIAALVLAAGAGIEAWALDLSGDLSLQTRGYPESPAHPGQRSSTVGWVLEPTLHGELTPTTSFTFTRCTASTPLTPGARMRTFARPTC